MKHPATNEPSTAAQKAAQELLAKVAAQLKTEMADATKKAAYKADWKKQSKYKTLTGYVFHLLYEKEKGGE